MTLRSSMSTAMPTPIPALAAVLRSGGTADAETDIVDNVVAVVAAVRGVRVGDAETLGEPDRTEEPVCELAVAVDDASEALVEAATSFPTVAASVNSLELVLQ